ncbi:MAG: transporter suffix domain-containing protein [Actinomycetota bacterium]|nr:transporter suffix domain-containing protein [Actinomycetota bacterium]
MRENEPSRSEDRPKEGDSTTRRRRWVLVVVLLVVPSALYAAVPVVAFLPLTTVQKIGISSGLVIAAEVVFWVAALFVGGAVISRYRSYFDPRTWSRKG